MGKNIIIMITTQLKSILTASGCTLVLYESDKLANLVTDQSDQNDIIGLLLQSNEIRLDVTGNGITERYPIIIEVLHQVRLEDMADNNEPYLESLLIVCKEIVKRLVASGLFKKIASVTMTKVNENRYDANVIGWSMPIELIPIQNELNC
jgi:hypothetical protein